MVNSIFESTPVFSQNVGVDDHQFIGSKDISSYKIGDKGQIIQRGSINKAFRDFADKFISEQSIKERNINVAMGIVQFRQKSLAEKPATSNNSREEDMLSYSIKTCKDAIERFMGMDANSSSGNSYLLRACLNTIIERMSASNMKNHNNFYDAYADITEINKVLHMDKSMSKHIECINLGLKHMQKSSRSNVILYSGAISGLVGEFQKKIQKNIINKSDGNHCSEIASKCLAQYEKDLARSKTREDVIVASEKAISLISDMLKGYDSGLDHVIKSGTELLKTDEKNDLTLQSALKNAFKEKIIRSTNMTHNEKKLSCEFLEKEFSTMRNEAKKPMTFVYDEDGHSEPNPNQLSMKALSGAVARQIETLDRIMFNNLVELNNTDANVSSNVIGSYNNTINAMPKAADGFNNELKSNFGNLLNRTGIMLNDYHLEPGGPQKIFDKGLPEGNSNKARQYELFLNSAHNARANQSSDIGNEESSIFYNACLTSELQAFHAGQLKKVPDQVIDFVKLAMSESGQNALCTAATNLMNSSIPQAHLKVTGANAAMLTTTPKLSTDLNGNIQLQMDFVQNINISSSKDNEHTLNTQAAMQANISIPAEQGQVNVANGELPNFDITLSYRPNAAD